MLDIKDFDAIMVGVGPQASAQEIARASNLITSGINRIDAELLRLEKVRDGLQQLHDTHFENQPHTEDDDFIDDQQEDQPEEDELRNPPMLADFDFEDFEDVATDNADNDGAQP